MAGADLGAEPRAGKKGKKHKTKKRVSVRIDMTPMVDVVMLLITFFMLTAYFSKPQTMEINIPPGDSKVEVAETSLLTLRVAADGMIFWNMGTEWPKQITFSDLRAVLDEKSRSNPKLITLLKVERDGSFKMMVDVMDEINLANITRFSLAPFTENDKKVIQKTLGS